MRHKFIAIALIMLTGFVRATYARAGWKGLTVRQGSFRTLVTAPNGDTHVFYDPGSGTGEVSDLIYTAANKRITAILPITTIGTMEGASDSLSHLHLVYPSATGSLDYGFYDGTQWSFQTIPNSACSSFKVATDMLNHPLIACLGVPFPCSGIAGLSVLSFDGANWSSRSVSPVLNFSCIVPSAIAALRVAPDGSINIAFITPSASFSNPPLLGTAKETAGTWSASESPPISIGNNRLSAVFDSAGVVHFAYRDNGIRHAQFDGSAWSDELVDPTAYDGSVGVNLDGSPHLLLLLPPKGTRDFLAYAKRSLVNGSWLVQSVGNGPDLDHIKLVDDAVGLPHFGLQVPSSGPDFTVYGFQAEPDMTAAWQNIQSATAKGVLTVTGSLSLVNQGTLTANGFTVNYYLSDDDVLDPTDQLLRKTSAGSLSPGKTRTVTFSFKPNGGVSGKSLIAAITSGHPEKEANLNNNYTVVQIP